MVPNADHLHLAGGGDFTHDRQYLGGADVEAHNQIFVAFL
jgi:hypothetical protein